MNYEKELKNRQDILRWFAVKPMTLNKNVM